MNFLDKLDYLMMKNGLNKRTLSQVSGIPYTTIASFYKKGYDNTKMSTAIKLASCLNVSLDYLIKDEINDEEYGMKKASANVANALEKRLVDNFNKLNKDGQSMLCELSQVLVDSKRYCQPVEIAARGGHQVSANQVDDLDDLIPPDAIHE